MVRDVDDVCKLLLAYHAFQPRISYSAGTDPEQITKIDQVRCGGGEKDF
jgi:hypothetical protein